MNKLNFIEKMVLQKLLQGEHPILKLLDTQIAQIIEVDRKFTGVGFYSRFRLSKECQSVDDCSFTFGDVVAQIDGLKYGAGFLLYIKNGLLSTLECYTYDEEWPLTTTTFSLSYWKEERDLTFLPNQL